MADNATTILISLFALGIVGVGFVRARRFGKLGLLAWVQSVVLMLPWLLFFGLAALGLYLNFAVVLFLFVVATGVYILLGRQLRTLSQDAQVREQLERMLRNSPAGTSSTPADASPSADPAPNDSNSSAPAARTSPTATLPTVPSIPAEDLTAIQGIFGIDTFFSTEAIPYQQGAIFRGNLRGEPEPVFAQLSARLQAAVPDRYRLYLINNPEGKPVVVVLPRSSDPVPSGLAQWGLAGILVVATAFTAVERGGLQYGFEITEHLDRWTQALPIGLGLMVVLLGHELGHLWMARQHGVKLGPPLLIPAWQLGSYGAITRFESVLPNRSVLFDVSFAGPAIGGILAFVTLVVGLVFSSPWVAGQPVATAMGTVEVPAAVLEGSILVGSLARVILGEAIQANLLALHPFVVVGWLGLVITALNLLPAGQLDGGRMMLAVYGRKVAGRATVVTLIFLAIASLANPIALYWSVLILFLQRQQERPQQQELTEPNDARAALCLLALFLVLATLLPLTPSLAGRLGFGVDGPQLLPL